jgi:hypothetical protein
VFVNVFVLAFMCEEREMERVVVVENTLKHLFGAQILVKMLAASFGQME